MTEFSKKSRLFAKHPYINFINITKFVISVKKRKKKRKCTPRKSNVNEYCIHTKTFLWRISTSRTMALVRSRGDELFFDEFVYLWSVEVYICTDVRNSSYLQKCASFTLVPYYSLHNHCRVLHVRTFATDFDRSIFFLAEYWMLFSAVHSHTKVTLDDYLFETDDKIQCYLQVKVFIYFYTCIVLFIIAS